MYGPLTEWQPRGDQVSMLTHTYPHKPLRKIFKWPYVITRLRDHFMCGLASDLVICKFKKVWSYMTRNVHTETRCHYTTQNVANRVNHILCSLVVHMAHASYTNLQHFFLLILTSTHEYFFNCFLSSRFWPWLSPRNNSNLLLFLFVNCNFYF